MALLLFVHPIQVFAFVLTTKISVSDPQKQIPLDLRFKVNGPSQIRYNEPAQFQCSSNLKDVELEIQVYQDNALTLNEKYYGGEGEIRIDPGEIHYGNQQFYIECGAYNEAKDWISYKHFVEVLCKFCTKVRVSNLSLEKGHI